MNKLLNWLYDHLIGAFLLWRFARKFRNIPAGSGLNSVEQLFLKMVNIPFMANFISNWYTHLPWFSETPGHELTTYPDDNEIGYSFLYGRIDVTCKLPEQKGDLFPAIWLLNLSQGQVCEVDLIELWSDESKMSFSTHWNRQSNEYEVSSYHSNSSPFFNDSIAVKLIREVHTYSLAWSKWLLRWYVDGMLVKFSIRGIPHQPMYIVLSEIAREDIISIRIG
jgi:hypothetical protein